MAAEALRPLPDAGRLEYGERAGPYDVGALVVGTLLSTERRTAEVRLAAAARATGLRVRDLFAVEAGHAPIDPWHAAALLDVYGTDDAERCAVPALAHRVAAAGERLDVLPDLYAGWLRRLHLMLWQADRVRATATTWVPFGLRTHRYGAAAALDYSGLTADDHRLLTTPVVPARLADQQWTVLLAGHVFARAAAVPGLDEQLEHLLALSGRGVDLRLVAEYDLPGVDIFELTLPGPGAETLIAEVTDRGVLYRAGPHGGAEALTRQLDHALRNAPPAAAAREHLRLHRAALASAAQAAAQAESA
ncbi:hypothetical protein [Kitasatospora sp. NPDC088783]|uniref:hypothetical protein n=1 Tax=Kitasatospora sp. NPDC088783 TaxID=3364077 RepID=UPI003814AD07